jgi:cell division protease FtsH
VLACAALRARPRHAGAGCHPAGAGRKLAAVRTRTVVLGLGTLLALTLAVPLVARAAAQPARPLSFSALLAAVSARDVRSAAVSPSGGVTGLLRSGTPYRAQIPLALEDTSLTRDLTTHGVALSATGTDPWPGEVLDLLIGLAMLAAVGWLALRLHRSRAGMPGAPAAAVTKPSLHSAENSTTRLADVAGYHGAKEEIAEIVHYLREPERYARAGARGPRGVLMVGPPGTGKTLVARAVAGEAGVPFFALSASSFVEVYVGVGAARVRNLFAEARAKAPSIVFIDEIDAVGQRRGRTMMANDEREQTLNQLLAEMDGFEGSSGVVVLAATNRPETLDPALLRPGRFDREVVIPLPNLAERLEILRLHARDKRLAPDLDLRLAARATPGFSGADLANLLNEAAVVAVRDGRVVISRSDLDQARTRVSLGRRDPVNALLPEEQRIVAVHEAGHALVASLCEHADPVSAVSILPAGRSLGVTELVPLEERHLYSRRHLDDLLAVRLGGRAAEQVVIGELTTGAADDLATAADLARRMVCDFGMSDELGPLAVTPAAPSYLGDTERAGGCAEETMRLVDDEVRTLLRAAEQRAQRLIGEHRAEHAAIVAELLEHETIDGSTIERIVLGTGLGIAAAGPVPVLPS